jgi:hypothetical protein
VAAALHLNPEDVSGNSITGEDALLYENSERPLRLACPSSSMKAALDLNLKGVSGNSITGENRSFKKIAHLGDRTYV